MLRQDVKENFLALLEKKGKIKSEQRSVVAGFNSFVDLEKQFAQSGTIKPEEFAQLKADFFQLPYVDLVGEKVKPTVLKIIPKELATNYQSLAYAQSRGTLSVAMVDPSDLKAREAIEFLARERGYKAEFAITSQVAFDSVFKQYSALKSEVQEYLGVAEEKLNQPSADIDAAQNVDDMASSAPIAKMVSVILKHAVEERASDIHIEPVLNQTRVRYRVDGVLKTSLMLPKYVHPAIVSRVKVMAKLKIDETRIPQDGRIRLKIADKEIDFRISTLPLYKNEKVVMRILDSSGGVLTLEDLGFDGRNLEVIQDNIQKPHGMFLVTGPTGSGKTTTLYAVLHVLNKETTNIVTLEDPVEYFLKGVNQSQVNPEVGLTFASGLRSILRQDPDVIMVGEIRDQETGDLAIHAGLTGHIVLSTLHTNDAFGAVPRFLDLGAEAFLLASTLNVVIAQRLVRKICQDCREETTIPEENKEEVVAELKRIRPDALPEDITPDGPLTFWKGAGCKHCGNTGYKGRSSIAEVLAVTDEIKELITAKNKWQEVKKVFVESGMYTLKQDGIIKALRGITTVEEVLRTTKD